MLDIGETAKLLEGFTRRCRHGTTATPTIASFRQILGTFCRLLPALPRTMATEDQVLGLTAVSGVLQRFRQLSEDLETLRLDGTRELLTVFTSLTPVEPAVCDAELDEPPITTEEAAVLLTGFQPKKHKCEEKESRKAPRLNIWEAAGLSSDEVRHSGVLAWFLDPEASHGQGRRMLRCLCREITYLARFQALLDEPLVVRTEHWLDAHNRTDIEVIGRSFALVIEVKIRAPLMTRQLERYWRLARARYKGASLIGLALTREGEIEPGDHDHEFQPIKWSQVSQVLRRFGGRTGASHLESQNKLVGALACQYARYLEHYL